jgi:hypothetical protein
VGVPAGGTTGQVLSKKTGTDYDTQWSAGGGGTADTRGYHRYSTTPPGDLVDGQIWLDSDLVVPPTTNPDHGFLTGLADDDHPQYLTEARQNFRVFTSTATLQAWAAANGSLAVATDSYVVYERIAGAWVAQRLTARAVGTGAVAPTIGGTPVDVPGLTLTVTTLVNHWYRFMSKVGMQSTASTGTFETRLLEDGINIDYTDATAYANSQRQCIGITLRQPAPGTHVYKLQAVSDAAAAQIPFSVVQNNLSIEDIGL